MLPWFYNILKVLKLKSQDNAFIYPIYLKP